jgi:hypothetical protein
MDQVRPQNTNHSRARISDSFFPFLNRFLIDLNDPFACPIVVTLHPLESGKGPVNNGFVFVIYVIPDTRSIPHWRESPVRPTGNPPSACREDGIS